GILGRGERGDAGGQGFDAGPARGGVVVLRGQCGIALEPVQPRDPLVERQVVEQAAERGELGVRVYVDQAGQERGVAQVDAFGVFRLWDGLVRADGGDAAVLIDEQRAAADRRRRDAQEPGGGEAERARVHGGGSYGWRGAGARVGKS